MPLFSYNLSSKIDIDVTVLFRLVSFQIASLKEASHSCVVLCRVGRGYCVVEFFSTLPPMLGRPRNEWRTDGLTVLPRTRILRERTRQGLGNESLNSDAMWIRLRFMKRLAYISELIQSTQGSYISYQIYWVSHQLESGDSVCLLLELATGRKAGSGFHSALSRLATPEFIYDQSLLSSWWETQ